MSTVFDILNEVEIKLHKIRYYIEKGGSDFEKKMTTVLHAYRKISMINNDAIIWDPRDPVTSSFDGIKVISIISNKLLPVLGKHPSITGIINIKCLVHYYR